jgi:hypothetical protein
MSRFEKAVTDLIIERGDDVLGLALFGILATALLALPFYGPALMYHH